MKTRQNHQSFPSSSVLEVGTHPVILQQMKRKELQKTRRYHHYPLSLEDVRIIDEIERSTKPIRFELCKRLNIKVGLDGKTHEIACSSAPFYS